MEDRGGPTGKASVCLHDLPTPAEAGASRRREPLRRRQGRTFRQIGACIPDTCWSSLSVTSPHILKNIKPIAVRSLEERFTHACTPEWRFGTQAWSFSQLTCDVIMICIGPWRPSTRPIRASAFFPIEEPQGKRFSMQGTMGTCPSITVSIFSVYRNGPFIMRKKRFLSLPIAIRATSL